MGYYLKIINIVTKLKQLRQSAGNYIFNFIRSSETLRNNLLNNFNPNNINLMRPFPPLWEGHETPLWGIQYNYFIIYIYNNL